MTTTQARPVASPLAWQPLPERPRQLWRYVVAVIVAVGVLAVASTFIHLPYYVESPGGAEPVNALIHVDPAHAHPGNGVLLYSTVALNTGVDPLQLLGAWLDPNDDIVAKRDLTGGISTSQFTQLNAIEMDQSKQDAIVVALRRLGFPVPEHGDGVFVTNVSPSSPADGRLQPGDVIVAIDGHGVSLSQTLVAALHRRPPGSTVTLTVERPRTGQLVETLPLASCPIDVCGPAGTSRSYLGVALQTRNDRFDFPFKVDIDLTGVGGPSAGLAFTLGIINALSTGDITGSHRVAVTGTIAPDGTVGPIGGIALKTVAVERAGADVFLVPKDDGIPGDEPQYSAAVAKARGHHLRVIAVGTLEDALNALRSIGGNLAGIGPAPAQLQQ